MINYRGMKKVLFVATVVKIHIEVFHLPYLKMFQENGWHTSVVARNDYENKEDCQIPYCDTFYDIPFERNPFYKGNQEAYRQLKKIINEGDFDIIHCHTPVGGVLARYAAKAARKKGTKVIYTAHGFHFFQGAPTKNWLLYYPVERHLARYTDTLITINQEDYQNAKHFPAKQVAYVPGIGIDTEHFRNVKINRKEKRESLGLSDSDYVLLSVGELSVRKNYEMVLKAIAQLKERPIYPRIQYCIAGEGALEESLKELAKSLQIEDHVKFIGFRNDIDELLAISDLFVFMSLQEGLPVSVMEAMAAGKVIIASDVRGCRDLIENGRSGWIAKSEEEIARLVEYCSHAAEADYILQQNAQKKVRQYDIQLVMEQMKEIYGIEN